jgi:hypothetical protein
MKRRRTLPPGSRHHEYWCAIFVGRPCNCEDPPRGDRRPIRRLGPGGAEQAKPKARAKQEEVA